MALGQRIKIPERAKLSDIVQSILMLGGNPFSLKNYPYWVAPFDSRVPELALFTGRQVAKSTYQAASMITRACMLPNGKQILIAPLQNQVDTFSIMRMKDFLESPVVKRCFFTGAGVVNQTRRKVFNNGHIISLGYASRSADRLRGQSVGDDGIIAYDEYQDLIPEVIAVVNEMKFRANRVMRTYTGTPKSTANHMEAVRARSTGTEWMAKCDHCGYWNHDWDERNVGTNCIVCAKCGEPLDTDKGEWVHARKMDMEKGKDSKVDVLGFRIPQLILKPVMSNPDGFRELLNKMRTYSRMLLYNEVFGLPYDEGILPIRREEIEACCDPNRQNQIPSISDPDIPHLVMGVDWALTGTGSRTVVVIGGWRHFPARFEVYFVKHFTGPESDTMYQEKWITQTLNNNPHIKLACLDWGVGQQQNLHIAQDAGPDKVMQVWHQNMKGARAGGKRASWQQSTRKWHLARTQVLMDSFELMRKGYVTFPSAEDEGIQMMIEDILAVQAEYDERTDTFRYVNVDPDDALHALTFCCLGSEFYLRGDFRGGVDDGSDGGGLSIIEQQASQEFGYDIDPDYDMFYEG